MHYQGWGILLCLIFALTSVSHAQYLRELDKNRLELKKEELENLDSFYDKEFDYSRFTGRVSDRDQTSNILKISTENGNAKFFRSGDLVSFKVVSHVTKFCQGYVRSVEQNFFVIYVKDIFPCWRDKEYFRRGTLLLFKSEQLARRVRDASLYRIVLLKRKKDFFKQLNDVNHFVWSYDQQKIKTAAEYDRKIVEMRKAKQRALEMLVNKKKDSIFLQKELAYRLDQVDRDLEFYRIEKDELLIDRWHLDQGLGLPVGKRPSNVKIIENKYKATRLEEM